MEKLKSRKFWAAVITAAYFALMAMKEQGVDNTVGTIIFGALTAFVVFGYIAMETWLDDEKIIENAEIKDDENIVEDEEEEAA